VCKKMTAQLWYAFLASMGFVFLKAIQQKNVQHAKYWWLLPTSIAMGVFELYVVGQVVKQGYGLLLVMSVGTGSGIGAILAVYLHNKVLGKV